jgi:hypothetical protein
MRQRERPRMMQTASSRRIRIANPRKKLTERSKRRLTARPRRSQSGLDWLDIADDLSFTSI